MAAMRDDDDEAAESELSADEDSMVTISKTRRLIKKQKALALLHTAYCTAYVRQHVLVCHPHCRGSSAEGTVSTGRSNVRRSC